MRAVLGSKKRRRYGTKADDKRVQALAVTLNHWTYATWLHESETLDEHLARKHPWMTPADLPEAIGWAIKVNEQQIQFDSQSLQFEADDLRGLRLEMIELAKSRNEALRVMRKSFAAHLRAV